MNTNTAELHEVVGGVFLGTQSECQKEYEARQVPKGAAVVPTQEISLETAKKVIEDERERLESERVLALALALANKDPEKIGELVKAGDLIFTCGTAKKVVQYTKNGKTLSEKADIYFLWRSDSITIITPHGMSAKSAPLERIAKHFSCDVARYAQAKGFTDVDVSETAVKKYRLAAKNFRQNEVVRLDNALNGKTAILRVDSASAHRKQAMSDASNLRTLEKNYSKLCESELGEKSKQSYIDSMKIAAESRAKIAAEREAKKAAKPTVKPSGKCKRLKVEPGTVGNVRKLTNGK